MIDLRRVIAENRRAVWVLISALLANLALYALVVRPLAQRVEGGEQQANVAVRDLNAARRAFQQAQGTVAGKQQAEAELQTFYAEVLPPDLSGARRSLYPHVDQLARSAGLRTLRHALSLDPDRRAELRKLTLTLTLAGEYPNVRNFIHDLETASEFLVLENVSVTQGGGTGELNVTALVATYFRAGGDGS